MSIRKLSPELERKATKEIDEDPQRLADGIKSLKEWIVKQPHLVNNVRTDDQWLAAFLRGCKYRMEITKSKFDMYYSLRSALPYLYKRMDPFSPKIQKQLSRGGMLILPKIASPDSPRIILCRTVAALTKEITPEDDALYNQMIFMYLMLHDDNAMVSGLEFIVDVKDTPPEILKYITAQNVKKVQMVSEKALPFRYKSVHYVNTPPTSEIFFTFIKGFMNEKTRKRLFVHSNVEAIYDTFPTELLPKEYGGNSYTIQDAIDDTKKKIESLKDIYDQEIHYSSNESLRLGKPVTEDSLFGLDGSFRKLNFD